jgi:hypothetical protein
LVESVPFKLSTIKEEPFPITIFVEFHTNEDVEVVVHEFLEGLNPIFYLSLSTTEFYRSYRDCTDSLILFGLCWEIMIPRPVNPKHLKL